jgi:hypothetical protein
MLRIFVINYSKLAVVRYIQDVVRHVQNVVRYIQDVPEYDTLCCRGNSVTVLYCLKCCEIWGYGSGDREVLCILGCDAVRTVRYLLTVWRNVQKAVLVYSA